ncbi:hypothetical protein ACUOFC_58080 [Escherichia sp. TWPC-MK]
MSIIACFIKREWNQSYTLRGVSRLLHLPKKAKKCICIIILFFYTK